MLAHPTFFRPLRQRPERPGQRALLGLALAAAAAALVGCDRPADPLAGPPPAATPPVAQVPAPASSAALPPMAAASPMAENEVSAAEDEEARSPALAERPTHSFARAAGLHRTPDPLRLTAAAALVLDTRTGAELYRKNHDAVLPIASLTKLMTGVVLLRSRAPLDETITITGEDVDRLRNSRSRLRVGSTLTRAEALHLALMSSENRAAHALGRTFPGGMNAFVAAMNNQARQLGMKDTSFVDPTGLSNRNQASASDVAILVAAASKLPLMRDYSTTPRWLAEFGGRRIQYLNSNRLIKDPDWDISLQKTGYIVEAGQCVTMRTRVAGRDLVMVLLDAGSKSARSADAERLRKWVESQQDHSAAHAAAPAPGVQADARQRTGEGDAGS